MPMNVYFIRQLRSGKVNHEEWQSSISAGCRCSCAGARKIDAPPGGGTLLFAALRSRSASFAAPVRKRATKETKARAVHGSVLSIHHLRPCHGSWRERRGGFQKPRRPNHCPFALDCAVHRHRLTPHYGVCRHRGDRWLARRVGPCFALGKPPVLRKFFGKTPPEREDGARRVLHPYAGRVVPVALRSRSTPAPLRMREGIGRRARQAARSSWTKRPSAPSSPTSSGPCRAGGRWPKTSSRTGRWGRS